ncbi:hypothetical protein JK636_09185 [Clostridium sp. YIM B02515]|uniref:Uncharacterized protein n=1 Tax=Clostridium rhizosphaerae TaxID=2803861 RepID=A0ABS1TB05_9CLOT|nr:hypothetical protein [Clostridium rhizosphaerae]MBL4935932.1 hypothetical protein [Clostridium rhizosphaerae]
MGKYEKLFYKRNLLVCLVVSIVLVLIMSAAHYFNNKLKPTSTPAVSHENNIKPNKLDIIKDIEYIALLQEGDIKGVYLDRIIFSNKDRELTDKIKNSILSGTVIENTDAVQESSNPLIIGIKQKDGNYLEGEYKDGRINFYKPFKTTVKTSSSFEDIIQEFKARKLSTEPQEINYLGQVRNNKIVVERSKAFSYGNDSVFEKFKGSDKKPAEYEQELIDKAVELGMDEKKLSNALKKAKQYKNNIKTQYPVIINTGVYRDKPCFILTFTWETANIGINPNKVQNLGHIFTVILDEEGNEICYSTCG